MFNLHGHYAYQMKAEIILNSYLLPKSAILYEIFWKKLDFKNFFFQFLKEKKFRSQIFWKFFLQPPNFFIRMILNTENGNYMKVWQSWRHPGRSGKQSKLRWADSTPPAWLGLRLAHRTSIFRYIIESLTLIRPGWGGICPPQLWLLAATSRMASGLSNLHVIFIFGV